MRKRNVLILGASYGSLLATKLAMAGHNVSLVCTRSTADLINRDGTLVRFPLKGADPIEISSNLLPGDALRPPPRAHRSVANTTWSILGMQEAQYGADGVRELMRRIARSRKPCLAIMNMPPLPYLKRIPGLDTAALAGCYADASVWEGFDPARITLASPDAQAFRPAGLPKNVLHVGLPTNFKAARFESEEHTELLRELEADIEQARLGGLEIPVKLKVHDSLFVPLAKWPMLIAGNYRCIRADGMVAIREAVHDDVARSREVYEWVAALCGKLGAQASRPGAVREIRAGRRRARQALVRRARPVRRRAAHRPRRPAGAAHRPPGRAAVRRSPARHRRAGGRAAQPQPPGGRPAAPRRLRTGPPLSRGTLIPRIGSTARRSAARPCSRASGSTAWC